MIGRKMAIYNNYLFCTAEESQLGRRKTMDWQSSPALNALPSLEQRTLSFLTYVNGTMNHEESLSSTYRAGVRE